MSDRLISVYSSFLVNFTHCLISRLFIVSLCGCFVSLPLAMRHPFVVVCLWQFGVSVLILCLFEVILHLAVAQVYLKQISV